MQILLLAQYLVQVRSSGQLTVRNDVFLWPYVPAVNATEPEDRERTHESDSAWGARGQMDWSADSNGGPGGTQDRRLLLGTGGSTVRNQSRVTAVEIM